MPLMEVVVHDTEIMEVMVARRDQMEERVDMVVVATTVAIMMSMVVEMVAAITVVVNNRYSRGALALQSCIFKLYYKSFNFCLNFLVPCFSFLLFHFDFCIAFYILSS